MPAIPLRGDRSAYDAENYRLLHANDIDLSASSIHHTLGSGAHQAASGSHTHDGGGGGGGTGGVSSDDYSNTWGGTNALESFTAGSLASDNTAFGFEALDYLGYSGDTWIGNTAFGSESGWWFESGNYNTFLGYNAGGGNLQLEDVYNSMGLGANTYTTKSNQIVIGDLNIEETLLRGTVILNEAGSSTWDFRVESDNQEYMIFLDSSANKLYLGGLTNGIAISSSSVDITTTNLTLNGVPIGDSLAPALNDLTDVHVPAPDDGNVLTWNAASGSWIAYPLFDWRVTLTQDETTDDSDKTFTVPTDEEWQILWIWVEFTSTATAGIRQVEVQLQDASSNVIGQFQSGVSQSEGLTYKYLFGIGIADLTSLRDYNNVTTPLPAGTFLSGGQKIRIWDNNAVDASADDMIVRVQYASRSFRIENYYVVSVNNSGHAQTSDGVVLTQYQVLAMNNASQLQTSGNVILTSRYATLVVQDSAHVLTSESPTLTYNIILQLSYVYSTTHLHTTGDIAFTQYHILVVQSTSQKLTNESVTLLLDVQHFNIPAVTNTAQAQTAQNTELTYRQQLDIQNSAHVQTADNTELSTDIHVLTIHDSSQLQTSGNISSMFTNKPVLGVKSSAHSQTSGKVTFSNMTTLEVNSSAHSQTSDSAGTLTQHQKELSVHNSSMKLITEKVTLFAP